ncbi:hypothetical protein GCM10022281_14550 [Sphingomonas rosea]|uniref:Glycosyltransferase n=1 Tax=Sphingomonas rosea TaxID=335605 RepID=A0ABP7U3P0_9SPHN
MSLSFSPAPFPLAHDRDRLAIAHVHTGMVGSGGDRVSELEACFLAELGHKVTMIGPAAPEIEARFEKAGLALIADAPARREPMAVAARTGALDIVHCHCTLSAPFAAALARESGAALVVHIHSMKEDWWERGGRASDFGGKRRRLRQEIDTAVAGAARVICVSEAVRDHMLAIGLPIGSAVVLGNPIDDIFFRPAGTGEERFDVAILARPSRAKSPLSALRILAEAQRRRPGLRMIWIGPLGHWDRFMRMSRRALKLPSLTFAGQLQPEEICNVLDGTRVLLSASNREGQPLSVLEALSRGCSAVLSDIPAHRPFAEEQGVTLFRERDQTAAGAVLAETVASHHRRARPALASHRVADHGRRLLDIYRSLVVGRKAS